MIINNLYENFPMFKILEEYLLFNAIVAGGCFKNILLGQDIKDVDLFFRNEKDFKRALSYYSGRRKFQQIYENNKAVGFLHCGRNIKIDLVRSVFNKPENLIEKFDFTVAKMAMYKETIPETNYATNSFEEIVGIDNSNYISDTKLIHHIKFFEHLFLKRLVIDADITFSSSTFERVLKYTKYGFNLCRESKIKMIQALQDSKDESISDSLYDGGFD